MKKVLVVSILLLAFMLYSKGNSAEPAEGLKDGVYFSQDKGFSPQGWKEVVTIVVENGKIVSANWNAANVMGGPDKKTLSMDGKYPMVENGGAQSDWHVQAKLVEDFYIMNPKVVPEYKDDEGHSDTISGASVHIDSFYRLVKKALEMGPVGYGIYKDGHYSGEAKEFSENSGWKDKVSFTVISGYIVAVYWDAIHRDGGDPKKKVSKDGNYGMKKDGGAMAEWHEQAEKVEKHLIDKQMKSDAVSGASINLDAFNMLVEEVIPKR